MLQYGRTVSEVSSLLGPAMWLKRPKIVPPSLEHPFAVASRVLWSLHHMGCMSYLYKDGLGC